MNPLVWIEHITAEDWRPAYAQERSDVMLLMEGQGREKSVHRIAEGDIQHRVDYGLVDAKIKRRLLMIPRFSLWENTLLPLWGITFTLRHGEVSYTHQQIEGSSIRFCVAVWFPAMHSPKGHDDPKGAIAWTMIPPSNKTEGQWKSADHFSMLPCSHIPRDGMEFSEQFISYLKGMWLKECDRAEDALAELRSEQLEQKGKRRDFILILEKEAKAFTILHAALRNQFSAAREFGNVIKAYHDVRFLGELQRKTTLKMRSSIGSSNWIKELEIFCSLWAYS
ncbi:hypothetical protein N656DRAFT_642109 [Canariomyces notabilis]|uniref:Uncharacterized protein n=1 Tax=Canariomyces notabilis TaxID=2074819 RepID=A0AAN6TFV7_9PEZI|nr:hypothetical protein N656DRAFT_642109 [Canariomyces arenarius]